MEKKQNLRLTRKNEKPGDSQEEWQQRLPKSKAAKCKGKGKKRTDKKGTLSGSNSTYRYQLDDRQGN